MKLEIHPLLALLIVVLVILLTDHHTGSAVAPVRQMTPPPKPANGSRAQRRINQADANVETAVRSRLERMRTNA